MAARLRIFGGTMWEVHGALAPVLGRMRRGVLLTLVEQHGYIVSVDSFLDRLWDVRPRSGPNAVQRHICALRRQLAELGLESEAIIESASGGYRLSHAVATDVRELEVALAGPAPDLEALDRVDWVSRPCAGLDEAHVPFRNRIDALAVAAFEAWAACSTTAAVEHRVEQMKGHLPGNRRLLDARRAARARSVEHEGFDQRARELLRDCLGLWFESRADEALDMLDRAGDLLPPDIGRRVCRWIIWLDAEDGFARFMLSVAVVECASQPELFERVVASLDGRCFEEMSNGADIARSEGATATSSLVRQRALRAEYMFGLSRPHAQRQCEIVDELRSVHRPDAIVEADRFAFVNLLRQGSFASAEQQLGRYEVTVAEQWPDVGDDFAPMTRAVLRRSLHAPLQKVFGAPRPRIPGAFTSDRAVVSTTTALRRLLLNTPTEPLSDTDLHEGATGIPPSGVEAMWLLRRLNTGHPVRTEAHDLADRLPEITREKLFLIVPVVLARVAEALGDRTLARASCDALLPWADELLGIWPADFVFGTGQEWLDRLESV